MAFEIVRKVVGGKWKTVLSDENGGGGSQPLEIVLLPLTPATPNILTGITLYTPTEGDVMVLAGIAVPTAWDGTSPRLAVITQGADPLAGDVFIDVDLTQADLPSVTGGTAISNVYATATRLDGSGPLVGMLYKGNTGGDPGASSGTAQIVLEVLKI